jgi:hypothetical protein
MADPSQSGTIGPDIPDGFTALYDDKGLAYLVPNFIIPAAKFKAMAEYRKIEIEHPLAPHGVGRTFSPLKVHCRCLHRTCSLSCDPIEPRLLCGLHSAYLWPCSYCPAAFTSSLSFRKRNEPAK